MKLTRLQETKENKDSSIDDEKDKQNYEKKIEDVDNNDHDAKCEFGNRIEIRKYLKLVEEIKNMKNTNK